MEKQNIPNSNLILIFGIISIVTCCCGAIPGLIFGIIALVLAKKARATYAADPELYSGYGNVKTGRILAIIGIVISSIFLIYLITIFVMYGVEGFQQIQDEYMREMERQQNL